MRALPLPARIRVGNERAIKEWVKYAVERVVYHTVARHRLVDIARFRIAYPEVLVRAMLVCARREFAMERENVVHKPMLKLLHVIFAALSSHEFFPRREQVFNRNDILVCMSEQNSLRVTPPPDGICLL